MCVHEQPSRLLLFSCRISCVHVSVGMLVCMCVHKQPSMLLDAAGYHVSMCVYIYMYVSICVCTQAALDAPRYCRISCEYVYVCMYLYMFHAFYVCLYTDSPRCSSSSSPPKICKDFKRVCVCTYVCIHMYISIRAYAYV